MLVLNNLNVVIFKQYSKQISSVKKKSKYCQPFKNDNHKSNYKVCI